MGDENKPIHARVLLQFLDFNDWLRDTLVPALPETEMRKQLVSRLDVIDELSEEVLLAVDLSRNDVEDIFKLGRAGETIVWDLEFAEYCAVPNCLFPIFQEFDYIAATPRSEALTRCRVNVLLLACLAAEQRSTLEKIKSQLGPVVDMNRLSLDASDPALALPSSSSNVNISDLDSCGNDVIRLSMEMTFKLEVRYKNRKRVLIASADFILWFGSVEDMAASLVVVVADETQEVEDCEARCLAVMCMIHTRRKKDGRKHAAVYGLCTDGNDFHFLYLSDKSSLHMADSRQTWDNGDEEDIVSSIRHIIRKALSATPTSTPV